MRIDEIASAADQLALWKLVSDSVWTAINQQVRDEAQRKAAEQRAAKPKGGKRKAKGAQPSVRLPLPPPPQKGPPPTQSVQKASGDQQQQVSKVTAPSSTATPPSQQPTAQQPLRPSTNAANLSDLAQQPLPQKMRQKATKTGIWPKSSAAAKNF